MVIIGVCGRAGSGKDEFYRTANSEFPEMKFCKSFFSKAVKEIASLIVFNNERMYTLFEGRTMKSTVNRLGVTNRELLIGIGDGLRKSVSEDIWIKLINMPKNRNIIVTDLRYPNEAEFIRSLGGIVVKINRNPSEEIETESSVDDVVPDRVIENNGTLEEYRKKVVDLIKYL